LNDFVAVDVIVFSFICIGHKPTTAVFHAIETFFLFRGRAKIEGNAVPHFVEKGNASSPLTFLGERYTTY
jgi:hypothetical protein